jgi:hypothetical protein
MASELRVLPNATREDQIASFPFPNFKKHCSPFCLKALSMNRFLLTTLTFYAAYCVSSFSFCAPGYSQTSLSRTAPGDWNDVFWFDNFSGMSAFAPPTAADDVVLGDSVSGNTLLFVPGDDTAENGPAAAANSISIGDDVNGTDAGLFVSGNLTVGGSVDVFNGSFDVIFGSASANSLTIANNLSGASMMVGGLSDIQFNQIGITDGIFVIEQGSGVETGVTINSQLQVLGSGSIEITFDDSTVGDDFDWALRVAGDQTSALQGLIDSNQLTTSGTTESVNLVYDNSNASLGNFTYVASGTASVPEPSGLVLLGVVSLAGILKRRRR